jgi:hypothetical protein
LKNSFQPLKDLKNYSANITNEYIIIFGGEDKEGLTNKTQIWDKEGNTFKTLEIVGAPSPRSFHNSLIWNDQLIIFGGKDKEKVLNDLYSLDLSKKKYPS